MAGMAAEASFPITDRSRRFGYVIWPSSQDAAMREVLGGTDAAEVVLNGTPIGQHRIDWKHRRISVGRKRTEGLREGSFAITRDDQGRVQVTLR